MRLTTDDDTVRIIVSDDGSGIPPDLRQTTNEGTSAEAVRIARPQPRAVHQRYMPPDL
ncbi:ATP-binding protein [Streptomyces sp. NPDC006446]|uniref:ATP-binding protein n=1 Tax=Streptomyces sp. NPDC006446 TaxID=3154301 RepID=UPI0033AF3BDD